MNCNNIIRENYTDNWRQTGSCSCCPPTEYFEQPVIENYDSDLCFRNSARGVRDKVWNCKGKSVPQKDPQGRYITQQRARQMCEHKYYQWNWDKGWRVCDGTPTSNKGKGWSCQMGTACRPPE